MRRPRSKLEVSTFPFLAVLLCAMGALLLLLFIMDRRAKVAAQNNARETLEARKKRSQDEEDARQAAWKKAQEQLHQALALQQEQLYADANSVNEKLNQVAKGIVIVQSRHVELEQRVQDEKSKISGEQARIAAIQVQIADRRAELKKAEKQDAMSQAELREATKELAELEVALLMMKQVKDSEKAIYSVVPYRGKRGDMRPPIYIECVRSGVIFHPEKKVLQFWEIRPEAMREEVERRAGPLRARQAVLEKGQTPTDAAKGPYVLFLIRPDGITHYYKAQAALHGYHVDFGYEFVDDGWVLDFTLDPYAKSHALALAAKGPTPIGGTGIAPGNGNGGPGDGSNGPYRGPGGGAIGGPPGQGLPGAYPGPGGPSTGPYPGAGGFGQGVGPGGTYPGPAGNSLGAYPPNGVSGTVGQGAPPAVGMLPLGPGGMPSPGPGGMPALGPGGIPPLPPPPGAIGTGAAGLGATSLPPPPLGASPGGPGFGGPNAAATPPLGINPNNPNGNVPGVPGGNGGQGTAGGPGTTQLPSGNPPDPRGDAKGPSFVPISRVNGPSASAFLGDPSTTPAPLAPAAGGPLTPEMIASAGPGTSPATTGAAAPQPGGDGSANRQSAAAGTTPNGQAAGSPGEGDGMPGPRPLPGYGADKPRKTAAPSPLSKVLGNKDFLITIDCFGDHVNVFPGGTLHRWSGGSTQAADQLLVQTVTNLIARRQASVRPGEPPYQPLIRFQVSTEGLRTYYHAYPLLEHLRVPMSRENVVE